MFDHAAQEAARRVPVVFDEYARSVGATRLEPTAECNQCGDPGACWTVPGEGALCHGCLRYFHGFETAEEKFARMIVGAAVSAALDAGAAPELVRHAVRDAFTERTRTVYEPGLD